MALGPVQALGARAGAEEQVHGFDGTDDGLRAVQAGDMLGTIAQQPAELGRVSVENALKAINGETLPQAVPVPVKAVNRDNVNEYLQ